MASVARKKKQIKSNVIQFPVERQFERLPIPDRLEKSDVALITINGTGCVNLGLTDEDKLLVRRGVDWKDVEPSTLCCVSLDGEIVLKMATVQKDRVFLESANPQIAPVFLKQNEVYLDGVVEYHLLPANRMGSHNVLEGKLSGPRQRMYA